MLADYALDESSPPRPTAFPADANPALKPRPISDHPIWPHARAAMTDAEAIRLRMEADILTARAACGYIDKQHQLAFGWTPDQLAAHFIHVVNHLAREGRLAPELFAQQPSARQAAR